MSPTKLALYKENEVTDYTLVDLDSLKYLKQWRWVKNYGGYVSRVEKHPDGKPKHQRTVIMHRVIMNSPGNMQVDHINGNKLDNRKNNLRICTAKENSRNVNICRSKLGYKGVSRRKGGKYKVFVARIGVDMQRIHLGTFETPEDAAVAYNKAAIKYYGEFAALNKVAS